MREESVLDVIVAMRRHLSEGQPLNANWFRSYVDRLEAAYSHERSEWEFRIKESQEVAEKFKGITKDILDAMCYSKDQKVAAENK